VQDVERIQVYHSHHNILSKLQEFPFIFVKSIQNGERKREKMREEREERRIHGFCVIH
jgi:hypothetical protein